MKKIVYILLLSVLLAGCALSTLNDTEVKNPAPVTPAVVEDDLHLGDPTFTDEVVEPRETSGAVVDVNLLPPESIEPEPEPTIDADLAKGLELHAAGKLRDARMALTAALNNDLDDEAEAEALATLRGINAAIFLSAGSEGDLTTYTVKAGDTLGKIAKSHGTTWEMIQRLNGLATTRIDVGQELKILGGRFELIVRKDKLVMDLMLDGAFIQRYEVGLGVAGCTPLGEFKVRNRIPRPADGSYPYGHEKHRLGTRWLGLDSADGHKGYGIHGCRPEEESQIPGECSQGCVRMKQVDVEEIYDIVPVGTRLVVQPR